MAWAGSVRINLHCTFPSTGTTPVVVKLQGRRYNGAYATRIHRVNGDISQGNTSYLKKATLALLEFEAE